MGFQSYQEYSDPHDAEGAQYNVKLYCCGILKGYKQKIYDFFFGFWCTLINFLFLSNTR